MLDIKLIRENPDKVKEGISKKGADSSLVDKVLDLDKKRRELIQQIDTLRAKKTIAEEKFLKETEENIKRDILQVLKEAKIVLGNKEKELSAIEEEFHNIMLQIPMPPAADVPEGNSDEDNVPVKYWGKIPKFNFPPKDYIILMESLDLLDLKRGAKIGGFRQYVIKNEAVLLEQALLRWTLDVLMKKGFTLLRPTIMVKEFALIGTGMFPKGKDEVYKTDDDLFLAGTTEVPIMAYHANEVLNEEELPKKYVGISEAFRREVGSYGKDIKGILRVHEFWQTEQIIICKNDEKESIKWHEELLKNSEQLLQALGLPYRVVNCCGKELSDCQVKRYDIEVWIPSQQRYRETHSDSYILDFQTRRLNIRYRTKDGKIKFAHSLNNTGIAVPRILIPLLENYQTKEGFVRIPRVLIPYMGGIKVIKRK